MYFIISLHCALASSAQCIVIGPVCEWVSECVCVCVCDCGCVCLWVYYHDNSKLRASIFTKLRLWVKAVTVSSWLNFGRLMPREEGLRRGEIFWLRLTTASAQCLRLSERFFSFRYVSPVRCHVSYLVSTYFTFQVCILFFLLLL